MALTVGTRNRVDSFLTGLRNSLEPRQIAYRMANGRYWQGLATSDKSNPPDGNNDVPPNQTRKPTDQTEDWTTMTVGLPANWPASLEVNTYRGPAGDGYVIVARVKGTTNEIWERIINIGPETHWERDWRQI